MMAREIVNETLRILIPLNNFGAISEDRSLTFSQIQSIVKLNPLKLKEYLNLLERRGYIRRIISGGIEKYYLTPLGIITALSIFS